MPETTTTVLEQISSEYYSLTAAEKKTADFVLSHLQETQYMSITELSEASGVAEATVSRFCRRLGYRGYNAFKLAIANTTSQQAQWANPLSGEVTDGDTLESMTQKLCSANVSAITQTMDLIDPDAIRATVDLLEAAGKVLCMGQGGSMILASEAAHLFSTVSGKFLAVSDSHSQAVAASMLDKDDVILYFSYSGSTLDMMQTLKLARRFMPGEEKKNLAAACAYFGVKQETAHRALSDAISAHLLYQTMRKRHFQEAPEAFAAKPLIYKVKKEQPASKMQKEVLRELVKYHRINLSVQIDSLSRNEVSRITDKIISQYGRMTKR